MAHAGIIIIIFAVKICVRIFICLKGKVHKFSTVSVPFWDLVIRPGTKEAEGLSKEDLDKRAKVCENKMMLSVYCM